MKISRVAAVLVATILLPLVSPSEAWNDPTSGQYHIQTDEGPERYFRYQTYSGQYRKEKRLEDGTVIGSYGWIDPNGFLRLRDYIADNAGYRILRSKNVFVGSDTPIEQAIKFAKKAPATSGTLVKSVAGPNLPSRTYTAPDKPQTPYTASIPAGHVPQVQITPNSIAHAEFGARYPAHVSKLVTTTESPISIPSTTASYHPLTTVSILPSSTPSSIYVSSQNPISDTTQRPVYASSSTPSYVTTTPSTNYQSTVAPPLNSNSVEFSGYSGDPQYEHYDKPFVNPYIYQNGPTYPIDRHGHTFNSYTNKIGNGYDPQYPEYDGVSVTNDGFRYYIPRAYHEEQTLPGEKRSGSFGYIDPFGIRRVVYYNTGPGTGFQHRKNNRYVGFDATPYDPRPY